MPTPDAGSRHKKRRRTGLRSCLVDALQVRPPACGLNWPAVCRPLDIQHTVLLPSECASPLESHGNWHRTLSALMRSISAPFRMASAAFLLGGPELPSTTQHDRSRRYQREWCCSVEGEVRVGSKHFGWHTRMCRQIQMAALQRSTTAAISSLSAAEQQLLPDVAPRSFLPYDRSTVAMGMTSLPQSSLQKE
ncbi:hypothetical protein GE09DRAFT_230268 [Coniochaeta sp. 2T2.1]|nr:hypothetical protein GE09DRAFT_230268 [Coniochaeta sp. 2T2.1]